ncbi:CGNR zinc finger domain-containing protein [Leifsonia flava]|uniref:Zinc finger CGNR domain-containing protein n=1 Tax=Orlajensenia leifsoniae TaxID=2561933 RepID=A0A4Y9QYH5_9MICO|nr:CGNR zinc finger domain-containing protein [Leifsonia flava]TFV96848.1 hypothetical protein E4M00_12325 [Leifsonia flava]
MAPPSIAAPREDFPRIAGHVALDLVNTVSWRLNPLRTVEHLLDYGDVIRWTQQAGVLDAAAGSAIGALAVDAQPDAHRELGRIIALREAIYEVAYHGGETEAIVREYAEAVASGRLAGDARQPAENWTWEFPLDLAAPRRRIAEAAVDLLVHGDVSHLRQCADIDCGWVYVDSSPRHNRRWCVAADCGNRNRVRKHYAQARAASAG